MKQLYSPFDSPLRYPGGKGKVAQFIRILLRRNGLSGGHYVEPYAGGAAVALTLLNNEFVNHIHINDLDPAIFAFWRAVVETPEELATRVWNTRPSLKEWRKQRDIYDEARRDITQVDQISLGFATFFLNRTNRSGIVTGGPIGGSGQSSHDRVDARYNAPDLARRILNVGANAARITVTNLDASQLLRAADSLLPSKSLIYLDPPYYEKGASKLYSNFYEKDAHAGIASMVRSVSRPWIVSYDDAPEIHRLYRGFRRIRYNLSYSANERRRGGEVMFFSDQLSVPVVDSPERIDPRDARRIERAPRIAMLGNRSRSVPREFMHHR